MTRGIWWVNGALLLVTGLALCSGCGSSSAPVVSNPPTQPTPQVTPGLPGTPTQPPPTVTQTPPPETPIPVPVLPATPPEGTPPTLPDPPATPTDTVKADVGVSKEGRSLDNLQGPFAAEARAYFGVREKVTFQIKIPGALRLYKAENNDEVPLTFDEFKEKVLDPNQIKLPPLPPGHTYEWDPEKEELMVRRPAK